MNSPATPHLRRSPRLAAKRGETLAPAPASASATTPTKKAHPSKFAKDIAAAAERVYNLRRSCLYINKVDFWRLQDEVKALLAKEHPDWPSSIVNWSVSWAFGFAAPTDL
jgi:hypothetical protein